MSCKDHNGNTCELNKSLCVGEEECEKAKLFQEIKELKADNKHLNDLLDNALNEKEQLTNDYEMLDASVEIQSMKIKQLQEENERLKKENEILLGQLVINDGEDVTVQISKSQFDEYNQFKDMAKKGLDEFKDVGGCWGCGLQLQLNQDMEDIKQLKADNERLKS